MEDGRHGVTGTEAGHRHFRTASSISLDLREGARTLVSLTIVLDDRCPLILRHFLYINRTRITFNRPIVNIDQQSIMFDLPQKVTNGEVVTLHVGPVAEGPKQFMKGQVIACTEGWRLLRQDTRTEEDFVFVGTVVMSDQLEAALAYVDLQPNPININININRIL